jgi:membrane protein DedA with SNARE-associated domain
VARGRGDAFSSGVHLLDRFFQILILAVPGPHRFEIENTINNVLSKMDIGAGGYFVLFGLLFSCGLGVPIPEDIPLLVAGALVGSGHMNLAIAAVVAWCGIMGGDCVLYYLGRRFGLNITKLPLIGKHVTKDRIHWAERKFEHYGVLVVAVGRLFAGIRGAMVITAGTIRYNFLKFFIADGLAAVVSGGLFMLLGRQFGKNLPMVAEQIHRYGVRILIVVIVMVIAFVIVKLSGAKKHRLEKKAEIHEETARGLDPRISKVTVDNVPAK